MKTAIPSLAPILRSDAQGRILAILLTDPTLELPVSDLAKRAGVPIPTATREIDRAERARVLKSRRLGNVRLVSADTANPLHAPLSQLVTATYGPPAVIAEAFSGIRGLQRLYLFGSWAARYQGEPGPAPRDVDVLVVGSPSRDDVYEVAEAVERRLAVPVQVAFRTAEQWAGDDDPFVVEIKARPLVLVLAEEGAAE